MTDQNCEEDYNHAIFRVDPCKMLALIGKYVEVTTQASAMAGFLYTADPVSQSVMLSVPIGGQHQWRLIPGSSIKEMVQQDTPPGVQPMAENESTSRLTAEEADTKRGKIVQWLRKNLLPVSVKGDVIDVHEGSLLIYPPYEISDCVTENSIVLGRMQHLLKNVPQ